MIIFLAKCFELHIKHCIETFSIFNIVPSWNLVLHKVSKTVVSYSVKDLCVVFEPGVIMRHSLISVLISVHRHCFVSGEVTFGVLFI